MFGEKNIKVKDQGEEIWQGAVGTFLPTRHTMDRTVSSSLEEKEYEDSPCPDGVKSSNIKRKIYLLKCEADLAGSDACSAVSRLEKRK